MPELTEWESFYVIVGSSAAALTGLMFVVITLIAYTALLLSAVVLPGMVESSLFVVAAVALSLVLIGIHNAWDTVTYLAISQREGQDEAKS